MGLKPKKNRRLIDCIGPKEHHSDYFRRCPWLMTAKNYPLRPFGSGARGKCNDKVLIPPLVGVKRLEFIEDYGDIHDDIVRLLHGEQPVAAAIHSSTLKDYLGAVSFTSCTLPNLYHKYPYTLLYLFFWKIKGPQYRIYLSFTKQELNYHNIVSTINLLITPIIHINFFHIFVIFFFVLTGCFCHLSPPPEPCYRHRRIWFHRIRTWILDC